METIVNIPEISPYISFENALWIRFVPMKLISQSTGNRGGSLVYSRNHDNPTYRFLAPTAILENIAHSWEPYDSLQKRLAEKVIALSKTIQETKAVAGGVGALAKGTAAAATSKNYTMMDALHSAVGAAGEGVIPYKIDSPLVYRDSSRREYTFTFQIVAPGLMSDYRGITTIESEEQGENIYNQLTKIVKNWQMMSAPAGSNVLTVELPYIFSIQSENAGGADTTGERLLNISYAACTAVQTTFKEPYIDGFPVTCDLVLTFKDISPLMRETIEKGSIISTSEAASKSRQKEIESTKQDRYKGGSNRITVQK